jgi:hypothetical protein
VVGSCEYGDEPSGSGATEIVAKARESWRKVVPEAEAHIEL